MRLGKIYPIKGSQTRFAVVLTNGPQFIAALQAMELKLSRVVARTAVAAAGEVLREEWSERAKAVDSTGRGEGHYGDSIGVTTRSSTVASGEGRALSGASATIAPRQVGGVPDDEQPARYAGVLEFGGTLSEAQHSSVIPPRPSAGPAFEAGAPKAVRAVEGVIRRVLSL